MADLFLKSNCTYCQDDVTGLRVKCSECPDFELCLQCFSAGAEIGPHKNDHPYQFCNAGVVGVTFGRGGWSAREEINLLDAVEVYGFGNWEDISRHIETRSSEDAKEQYTSRYLEGTIGRLTWPTALARRPNLADCFPGPASPTNSRLPPLDVSAEEAKELSYMPLREDYDSEFENDAESLLASLCANETEEDDLDLALSLVQVDMYEQTLRERVRRKRVARDYQLVSQFFIGTARRDKMLNKKKLAKDEKEFQEGMKVFCQFHTSSEHEQFLQNMQREQELKLRLSELQRYRRHGITRHEECVHLEQLLYNQQAANGAGSSGANPSLQTAVPLFPPAQLSTYLRKRGKSDETVLCSTERKFILGNLGVAGCRGPPPGGLGDATPLLSKQEMALCATLALTPAEYLALKTAVIKDGDIDDLCGGGGIESTVQTYLTQQGWLQRS